MNPDEQDSVKSVLDTWDWDFDDRPVEAVQLGLPLPTTTAVNRAVDARRSLLRWHSGIGGTAEGLTAKVMAALRLLVKASQSDSAIDSNLILMLVQAPMAVKEIMKTGTLDAHSIMEETARIVESTHHTLITDPVLKGSVTGVLDGYLTASRQESEALEAALEQAHLYVADRDMCEVLTQTRESFSDYALQETDLLAPSGIVIFAAPIEINYRDKHPAAHQFERLTVEGLLWYRNVLPKGGEGVIITTISKRLDLAEELGLVLPGQPGLALSMSSIHVPFGQVTTEAAVHEQRVIAQIMPMFFALARQPIAQLQRATADKRTARNARRAGVSGSVNILMLRPRVQSGATADADAHPKGKVEWKSRWIVDAFWRNQWYPSIKAHRPILIQSYVKGPQDKPLVVSPKVWVAEGRDLKEK